MTPFTRCVVAYTIDRSLSFNATIPRQRPEIDHGAVPCKFFALSHT